MVALAETGKLRVGDCGAESPKDGMVSTPPPPPPPAPGGRTVSSESPHGVAFRILTKAFVNQRECSLLFGVLKY